MQLRHVLFSQESSNTEDYKKLVFCNILGIIVLQFKKTTICEA